MSYNVSVIRNVHEGEYATRRHDRDVQDDTSRRVNHGRSLHVCLLLPFIARVNQWSVR